MKLLVILSLATLVFSKPQEGTIFYLIHRKIILMYLFVFSGWLGPQPFAALERLDCSTILGKY